MSGFEGIDAARAMLRRTVVWGAVAAAVVAVVAAGIGFAAAGAPGALSGFVGAAFAFVFLGLTALALAFAGRLPETTAHTVVMAWMLGGWFVKFALFVVAMLVLNRQPWVVAPVLFGSIVVTVLVSLVIDIVVFARSRIPIDPGAR